MAVVQFKEVFNVTGFTVCSVYGQRLRQLLFKRFINGNESLKDQEDHGRKSSDINDSLSDLVSLDPFLSSKEMVVALHTSHTTILSHLRDLGKKY